LQSRIAQKVPKIVQQVMADITANKIRLVLGKDTLEIILHIMKLKFKVEHRPRLYFWIREIFAFLKLILNHINSFFRTCWVVLRKRRAFYGVV